MSRNWSEQQKAIFEWFATGGGNLIVRARAGTGKTTTLVEAMSKAPEQFVLACAFNKRIQKELQAKVLAAGGRAEVKTLHGVGFSIVQRYWERCQVDANRGFVLAQQAAGEQAPDEMIKKIQKLAGLGKGCVVDFHNEEETCETLEALAIRFDLEPDDTWQKDGWTTEKLVKLTYTAMELATRRTVNESNKVVCDFDDMLFLPLANNWAAPRYDLVCVDEAQDMNAAQLELAKRIRNPGGRTVVIGDDRQAIYGFRGADSGALDRLKKELNAAELGLTCTYRCGKAIVAYAKTMVPDFEAAETNVEGMIEELHETQLVDTATPGDFVLSRKNAPLVSICLRLLKKGKPARIEGKDIAAGLKTIVKRWKLTSIVKLVDNIEKWRDREIEKIELKKSAFEAELIETVKDKAEILLALTEGLSNPAELITRLETLFGNNEEERRPMVVCSSIHKSKGLEASRVFILKSTLYPQRKAFAKEGYTTAHAEKKAREIVEEQNLEYVAVTRAIDRLVWVAS